MLKMQLVDVQKPLISVARFCDGGHTVVFTSSGGYIQIVVAVQTTMLSEWQLRQ